jgi:hypothetical protein
MVQPCTFRNLLRPAAGQLILPQDNSRFIACLRTLPWYNNHLNTRSSIFNMVLSSPILPGRNGGQAPTHRSLVTHPSSSLHLTRSPAVSWPPKFIPGAKATKLMLSQFQEANMPPRTSTKFCSVPSQCPPISCQTNHRQQLLTQLLNIKAGQPATQDATQ